MDMDMDMDMDGKCHIHGKPVKYVNFYNFFNNDVIIVVICQHRKL